MVTLNEQLRDRVVRHATALERYKAGVIQDIVRLLDEEIRPAVLARLEARLSVIARKGYDRGLETTARLRELAAALDGIIKEASALARKKLSGDLYGLAKAESAWTAGLMGGALPAAAGFEAVLPAASTLRAIVTGEPINGVFLKDWFKAFERSSLEAVSRQVNIGLVAGETPDAMRRRLLNSGVFEGTKREAEVLVRTAASHTAAEARHAVHKENADVIKGEQWVATLDHRTCRVCGPLDGKVFGLDDGRRPPAHPNCRCTIVPVLKSWRDLGIDLEDIDSGTRASMNGQVPATTTFSDWLKSQSPDAVADVLGSKKAATAFLKGEVSLPQFSTKWGKPLSLEAAMAKG